MLLESVKIAQFSLKFITFCGARSDKFGLFSGKYFLKVVLRTLLQRAKIAHFFETHYSLRRAQRAAKIFGFFGANIFSK